jgi:hypothetical protein
LRAALPADRLEAAIGAAPRRSFPGARRQRPIPTFLISFNRGEMLMRCIEGVRRQRRATEIVVHDNGSNDGATLEVLQRLEQEGVRVVRRPAICAPDELNNVDETVQAYFSDFAEPCRYVVSDCDVDLSVADPRALDVYDELLNKVRNVECVGPMLRIRDVPRTYPLFKRAMNRHIEQFWRLTPIIRQTSWGEAAILESAIDTTFALHRAAEPFRRHKWALRVYEPFEARHLDWYPSGESTVYRDTSSAQISHWNNNEEQALHIGADLEYASYTAVRVKPDGELEIYTEYL